MLVVWAPVGRFRSIAQRDLDQKSAAAKEARRAKRVAKLEEQAASYGVTRGHRLAEQGRYIPPPPPGETELRQRLQADAAIRRGQDEEYRRSLAADRARVDAARAEAEAEERAAEAARAEEARAAAAAAAARAAREAELEAEATRRRVLLERLGPEPPAGGGAVTVSFRLPGGRNDLRRRFAQSNTLQQVLHFLESEGVAVEGRVLATAFPRQVLSNLGATLESAGVQGRVILHLEES